jgi:hypothetical protein
MCTEGPTRGFAGPEHERSRAWAFDALAAEIALLDR